MSTAIENVAAAYKITGSAIARRVLSIGIAQRDTEDGKKLPAHVVHTAGVAYATEHGIILDNFSSSTVSNAATSFDLYVSTGLPVPSSANTRDGAILGVVGLVESARAKHLKKKVADAIKVALGTLTEYDDEDKRRAVIVEYLTALIDLDAEKPESKGQTPAQRFLSALRAADTLALEVELSDEDVTEALRLIASITVTAESWS